MQIGDRIKAVRCLVEDLTAAELSSLVGVSSGYVALLEAGTRSNPSSELTKRLAKTLGCSVGWLAAGEGDGPDEAMARAAVKRARLAKSKGKAA